MDTTWSVLVVDDDVGIRQSLRLCLEVINARVLGVGTAAAALEVLEHSPFDLVLLDLWLGQESGLTILPEILRCQPGICVIVITAFASFETAVEAMRLGAVDYLPKPFTPQQVRHAAQRVVANTVLRRQVAELKERSKSARKRSSSSPRVRAMGPFSRPRCVWLARIPSSCCGGRAVRARTCLPSGCAPTVGGPTAPL